MDLDQEEAFKEFIQILLPDGENLDAEQLSYLSRLGSLGLDSLNGEVARLGEELAIVQHQMKDMASQNYQIFVQSAQTTNQIKNSLEQGSKCVAKLTENTIPSVITEVNEFSQGATGEYSFGENCLATFTNKKDMIGRILEMPWLLRKALAQEKLPDAIRILQLAMDMEKSLQSPLPILIERTCEDVMKLKSEIQEALLAKLAHPNIGLSECLQTVSLLRSFFPDDKSLRFRFLQSRMKEIPFEKARTWIFDTLTQHRAAFGGDTNHFLSTWVSLQMSRVLGDMERQIDEGDNFDTLIMQALYFGESLARVGSDMRGLLIPLFIRYFTHKFEKGLGDAEKTFSKSIHQFNLSTAARLNHGDEEFNLPPIEDFTPPKALLAHTPLAVYLNSVLTLLNLVGKNPLIQSALLLVSMLNKSIEVVGDELELWGKAEWLTWEMREQGEFNRMKRNFTQLLVPHLDKATRLIFPPQNISLLTGLGISKCSELIQIKYNVKNPDS